jgi:hypothetical protein
MIKKLIPIMLVLLIFLSISAVSAAETKFNTSTISTSAKNVQNYVETNKKLPSTVKVSNTTLTTPKYLYLLAKDVQNVNKGVTTPITLVNATSPPNPNESVKAGTLTKAQYLTLAANVAKFIETNKRPPNFVSTPLGNMRYENAVYTLSKVLAYYKTNNRLPNTVSVKKWSTITGSSTGISPGPIVTFTDTSKTTTKTLGSNSLGTVQKIGPFGTGTKKVAVIIGVHPQEGITHVGMMNALKTLASQLKNVQIWVFKVSVNEKNSYEKSRMDGQLLAQKYVVPNIVGKGYKLAVDIHGNRGLYATNDFVFAPSGGTLSKSYANKIIAKTTYLKYYSVADGSSPKYVTKPIAAGGIPAVIFELYLNVNNYNTVMYNKCMQLVKALNTITYT